MKRRLSDGVGEPIKPGVHLGLRRREQNETLNGVSITPFHRPLRIVRISGQVALVVVVTYFAVWTATFIVVTRAELSLYTSYFRWSWTGGGELPAFIHGIAFLSALLTIPVSLWRGCRRKRNEPHKPTKAR